jgi:SAM-dependent methyltransferase
VDRDINSFDRILDFGCGCGRTLLWLAPWAERTELDGTDIDRDAISWCRGSIRFARFAMNDPLPPLPYPEKSFDLVYLISVFTHLTEDLQLLWLEELRRVSRPGGYVLVTLRGSYYQGSSVRRGSRRARESGIRFFAVSAPPAGHVPGVVPDGHAQRRVRPSALLAAF